MHAVVRLFAAIVLVWGAFLAAVTRASDARLPSDRAAFLNPRRVWEIRLRIPKAQWDAMQPTSGPGSAFTPGPRPPGGMPLMGLEFPWAQAEVRVEGVVFTNVGVRFKGNSSYNLTRNALKRPFKLDFDRHVPGRTLAGLEEVFLNNNANDPTQARETLAYAAFRAAGIPAPLTGYARVELDFADGSEPTLLGLYTLVEPVEGDFLKTHFNSGKGLLLKPERMRGLEYLGDDWSRYTNRFEPKSKVRDADTRRFISTLRSLTQDDDAAFASAVTNHLDLDAFLRFVALNAWLANYDSFLGNGHNYYLYQHPGDGRLHFIPWDLNEAFGRHPGAGDGRSQAAFSILEPHVPPNAFLDRILARPEGAGRYRRQVEALHRDVCATNRLLAEFAAVSEMLKPHLAAEPPLRFGGPPRPGGPDGPGPRFGPGPGGPGLRDAMPLPEWILERHRSVAAELDGTRTAPRASMRRMGPGSPGGPGGPGRPRRPEGERFRPQPDGDQRPPAPER